MDKFWSEDFTIIVVARGGNGAVSSKE